MSQFNLARALTQTRNVKLLMEVSLNDATNPETKVILRRYIKKLNWIITDFHTNISAESSEALKKEMFNEDMSLQIEGIIEEVMDTTPEQREIIEEFIIELKKGKIQVA